MNIHRQLGKDSFKGKRETESRITKERGVGINKWY
jgi:hypothetical protein